MTTERDISGSEPRYFMPNGKDTFFKAGPATSYLKEKDMSVGGPC